MDNDIKEMFSVVLKLQEGSTKAIITLAEKMSELADLQKTLTLSVNSYVAASNARIIRLEENLDGLIRAITQEHKNGKKS